MKQSGVKTIFRILGGLFVFGGIIAGTILVQRNQDIREKAAPATSLSIAPPSVSLNPGDNQIARVVMDTSTNSVVGADIEIAYDPAVFNVTDISRGTDVFGIDQEIKKEVDNTTGRLAYSIYTTDKTKAVTGTNLEVLSISYTIKTDAPAGTHTFNFTQNTAVAATSEGQNVLIGTNSGSVSIVKIGDVNRDGHVNIVDIGIIIDNYQITPISNLNADLNGDGKVNIVDIGIVVDHYEN